MNSTCSGTFLFTIKNCLYRIRTRRRPRDHKAAVDQSDRQTFRTHSSVMRSRQSPHGWLWWKSRTPSQGSGLHAIRQTRYEAAGLEPAPKHRSYHLSYAPYCKRRKSNANPRSLRINQRTTRSTDYRMAGVEPAPPMTNDSVECLYSLY